MLPLNQSESTFRNIQAFQMIYSVAKTVCVNVRKVTLVSNVMSVASTTITSLL